MSKISLGRRARRKARRRRRESIKLDLDRAYSADRARSLERARFANRNRGSRSPVSLDEFRSEEAAAISRGESPAGSRKLRR